MTALFIILGIALIIFVLLFCRVHICVSYNTASTNAIRLSLLYLFLKLRLLPKKTKPPKLSDFSYKKTHPSKKKGSRADEQKKKKKKKSDTSKSPKKESKKTQGGAEEKEEESSSILSIITRISDIIADIIKRFPSKLRLDISCFRLYVGGKDAASAAVTYGAVVQAVGALVTLLERSPIDTHRPKHENYVIEPDFLSGKINADIKMTLSIRPASVLHLGLSLLIRSVIRLIKGEDD
ncbi:MAG: hypothetical protein LUH54_02785 [Firmicutes bacterium]|nr:hypothetical protein [Bacillota bacterium]